MPCIRRPIGFICVDQDALDAAVEQERETRALAQRADEWHRHNRWRKWRCLTGGKAKQPPPGGREFPEVCT